ncbi:MAG: hypothetical protein CM15mP109_11190 [Candidatus Dadabacteria bacterium]|nr:MAG: hypothetical protein CM15mP109_11190 [Candidatus Dadabacteria bacterium]
MEKVRSPFRTAEAFIAGEIIDPRDTKKILSEFENFKPSKFKKKGKTKFWELGHREITKNNLIKN